MSTTAPTTFRAKYVIPIDAPPIENGAVEVIDGRITAVDTAAAIKAPPVVDFGECVLLPGFVTGELLQELWCNAYVIAQPSTIEGLSISLLEALSYGNCVLISDIPENVEVSGDCAVTFKSKDVADLKEKLEMLLSNEDVVRDYRKRAKQCVRERYDWEKVVDSTEQLYESVRNS